MPLYSNLGERARLCCKKKKEKKHILFRHDFLSYKGNLQVPKDGERGREKGKVLFYFYSLPDFSLFSITFDDSSFKVTRNITSVQSRIINSDLKQ